MLTAVKSALLCAVYSRSALYHQPSLGLGKRKCKLHVVRKVIDDEKSWERGEVAGKGVTVGIEQKEACQLQLAVTNMKEKAIFFLKWDGCL